MRIFVPLFLAVLFVCGPSVRADSVTELQFILDSVTIQSKDVHGNNVFNGKTHTGVLNFGYTAGTSTEQVLVDGDTVCDSSSLQSMQLSGSLFLLGGQITGGVLKIGATLPGHTMDTYEFDLSPSSGSVNKVGTNNRYRISASTASGVLSGTTYAGANVATWYNRQPLAGSFLQLNYKPDVHGFDRIADINISAVTTLPLPKSALMGITLFGIICVGVIRNRLSVDRRSLIS